MFQDTQTYLKFMSWTAGQFGEKHFTQLCSFLVAHRTVNLTSAA